MGLVYSVEWVWLSVDWVCLSLRFSCWSVCSELWFMTVLHYAYHVHGRVSQWQLFVTVWCSLITLYYVVTEHSSFLNNCYILKYTMLQCCLCILGAVLVHVPCLSEISLWNSLPFFFTNMNLIKLMFVSYGVALSSLLCVCSLANASPFL